MISLGEPAFDAADGIRAAPGEHQFGRRPIQSSLPESTPGHVIRQRCLHPFTQRAEQGSELAIGLGDQGFELGAQHAGQYRRIATGAYSDDDR